MDIIRTFNAGRRPVRFARIQHNDYKNICFLRRQTPIVAKKSIHGKNYFRYIRNQTDKICISAIKNSSANVPYIRNLTYKMAHLIVVNYPSGLSVLKKQTRKLCMIASLHNVTSILFNMVYKNREICQRFLSRDPYCIDNIPPQYLTKELCLFSAKRYRHAYDYIPEELLTYEICEAIISLDAAKIDIIPSKFVDKKLFILSLINGYVSIKYNYKVSNQIYVKAVKKNPLIINDIQFTIELFKISIDSCSKLENYEIDRIKYIPPELYEYALEKNPHFLKLIPENCRTYDMCLKTCGKVEFFLIPEKYRTTELCTEIIKYRGDAIFRVEDNKITYKMWKLAITSRLSIPLKRVPYKYKTYKMCKIAINRNPFNIKYVPDRYMNDEFLKMAINKIPESFSVIPIHWLSDKIVNYALSVDFKIIFSLVPNSYKTQKMCITAVRLRPSFFNDVPPQFQSEEIILTALNRNGNFIRKVINQTPLHWYIAQRTSCTIKIPDKFKTSLSTEYKQKIKELYAKRMNPYSIRKN